MWKILKNNSHRTIFKEGKKNNKVKDHLRWGYKPTDTFAIKEAYNLALRNCNQQEETIWNKLWKGKFWPEFYFFYVFLSITKYSPRKSLCEEALLVLPDASYVRCTMNI